MMWLRLSRNLCEVAVAHCRPGNGGAVRCGSGSLRHVSPPPQHPTGALTIFDSDPNHIWNRTYTCLFVRQSTDGKEYGADALDPLLWNNTQHLLTGDSHRRALACLDEFLRSHAERAVQNPLKRAILQRDLWAVFDWTARNDDLPEQRRELESRLAVAIHRLALTPEQIRALPDTYDAAVATHRFASAYDPRNPGEPFLPPDLFRLDGPWAVSVRILESQLRSSTFIFLVAPVFWSS